MENIFKNTELIISHFWQNNKSCEKWIKEKEYILSKFELKIFIWNNQQDRWAGIQALDLASKLDYLLSLGYLNPSKHSIASLKLGYRSEKLSLIDNGKNHLSITMKNLCKRVLASLELHSNALSQIALSEGRVFRGIIDTEIKN